MSKPLTEGDLDRLEGFVLSSHDVPNEETDIAVRAVAELRELRALLATPFPSECGDEESTVIALTSELDEPRRVIGIGAALIRAALDR